jgi:hypothetical protein
MRLSIKMWMCPRNNELASESVKMQGRKKEMQMHCRTAFTGIKEWLTDELRIRCIVRYREKQVDRGSED